MPYLVLLQYYEHMWCTMRRHSEAPLCEPITNPIIGVLGISWMTQKMTWTNISQYILRTNVHANSVVRKIARNIGTHFRCKLWTKFRPQMWPIKRYHIRTYTHVEIYIFCGLFYLLIDRPESFDGIVKNKLPVKLFFFYPSEVPLLYRTYVLCTQGRRNISLIGRTAVGSLSAFEWAETWHAIS
jgi:hypothetical protein